MEVHLFDFSGDLWRGLAVELIAYLRGEETSKGWRR
jgi:FAD synthase